MIVGEKNSPCTLNYEAEYERIREKYEELYSQYMEMKPEYERMKAQLDIVYLIFGGKEG